jgi:hypothetical protein
VRLLLYPEASVLIRFSYRHACGENPSKLHFSFSRKYSSNTELEVACMVTLGWTISGLSDRRAFYIISSIFIPANSLLSQI